MLDKENVEVLVVTTMDSTHDLYISEWQLPHPTPPVERRVLLTVFPTFRPLVPALKRGIHVVTEKPMTTDAEKCKAILRAVKETGNHLTVTFVSRQKAARRRNKPGRILIILPHCLLFFFVELPIRMLCGAPPHRHDAALTFLPVCFSRTLCTRRSSSC
jgi:hypothetical protein